MIEWALAREAVPIERRRELGAARGLTREVPGWDAAMTEPEADEFMENRPE